MLTFQSSVIAAAKALLGISKGWFNLQTVDDLDANLLQLLKHTKKCFFKPGCEYARVVWQHVLNTAKARDELWEMASHDPQVSIEATGSSFSNCAAAPVTSF